MCVCVAFDGTRDFIKIRRKFYKRWTENRKREKTDPNQYWIVCMGLKMDFGIFSLIWTIYARMHSQTHAYIYIQLVDAYHQF